MNPNSTDSSGVVSEPDSDSDPFLRFGMSLQPFNKTIESRVVLVSSRPN